MTEIRYDCEAWEAYPQHRWVFNKLELALRLGHSAGPGGTDIPVTDDYIIRPIYNLSGMGVGARKERLQIGDHTSVKPGEFWCEWFEGDNFSIDVEWDGHKLVPVHAARGIRPSDDISRFDGWKRIDPKDPLLSLVHLPMWLYEFQDVPKLNIELVGSNIIEIHLRHGNDFPEGASEIIPVWEDKIIDAPHGYKFVESIEDADTHLTPKRLGFYWR